jgi:hypothetical protein
VTAKYTPIVGGAAKASESTFNKSVRDIALQRARPKGAPSLKSLEPHEAIQEIEDQYIKRYAGAWQSATLGNYRAVVNSIRTYAKQARGEYKKTLADLAKDIDRAAKANNPEAIDKYLDAEIASAANDPAKREMYDLLVRERAGFRDVQPDFVKQELLDLDKGYNDYKTMELALGKGPTSGQSTPKNLEQALRSGRTRQLARGTAPYQKLVTDVLPFVPPSVNPTLSPIRSALLKLAPEWSPSWSEPWRKYMFGEHDWQRRLVGLADRLRKVPSIIGAGAVSAGE